VFLDHFTAVENSSAACGRAMQSRNRASSIEDVQTDAQFAPHRPIASAARFCAVQSTPLFSRGGEILGMIFDSLKRPTGLRRELRLTDLYAQRAAEMIERKRTR